jgi:hypothetical protein
MGRRFISWSWVFFAAGVAFLPQPGEAGERRAAVAHPVFATATAFTTPAFASAASRPVPPVGSAKVAPRVSEPERKTITLLRFTSRKLGEISVQPVVGGVNGAQLSIGF